MIIEPLGKSKRLPSFVARPACNSLTGYCSPASSGVSWGCPAHIFLMFFLMAPDIGSLLRGQVTALSKQQRHTCPWKPPYNQHNGACGLCNGINPNRPYPVVVLSRQCIDYKLLCPRSGITRAGALRCLFTGAAVPGVTCGAYYQRQMDRVAPWDLVRLRMRPLGFRLTINRGYSFTTSPIYFLRASGRGWALILV